MNQDVPRTTPVVSVDYAERAEAASSALERLNEFFGRVESKLAFVLTYDGVLLVTLLANLEVQDLGQWFMLSCVAGTLVLVAGSIACLFRASMPQLASSRNSLVYFEKIANLSESNFECAFLSQDSKEYALDLTNQVWRNAVIVGRKFRLVNLAFRLSAAAILPWGLFLLGSILIHGKLPIIP